MSGNKDPFEIACEVMEEVGAEMDARTLQSEASIQATLDENERLWEALKSAHTYLRDIAELKRENILKDGEPVSIHGAYEMALEIARNGFNELSKIVNEGAEKTKN